MSRKNRASTRAQSRRVSKALGDDERSVRIYLTAPDHGLLRPARHETSEVRLATANTDIELLFQGLSSLFDLLGYSRSPELLVGALASTVNRLTPELRRLLVQHVLSGSHLYIEEIGQDSCTHINVDNEVPTDLCGASENAHAELDYGHAFTPPDKEWVVRTKQTYEPLLDLTQVKQERKKSLRERLGLVVPS